MKMKIGKKVSEGGCSEVFEYEDDKKIIKLAKANTDIAAVRKEFNNSRVAWESGLPVPKPFEVVDIDGRPGIVFERIYGETLAERFFKQFLTASSGENSNGNLSIEKFETKITARVLSEVHSRHITNMPSQRDSIKHNINAVNHLTAEEKEAVISILDNLPVKQQLCHGDPNPNNIFIREGRPVIIDWMNASIGNPEADLAEYIIMIKFAILPESIPKHIAEYFETIRDEIIRVFIEEYRSMSNISLEDIDPWITLIAARKLHADGITEDEKKLLVKEIRRRLRE